MARIFKIIFLVGLIGFFLFGFLMAPSGRLAGLARSIFFTSRLEREVAGLKVERQNLLAELYQLSQSERIIKNGREQFISARVYSEYPFNNRQLIVLNVGSESGIKVGSAVTIGENLLLGRVVEVLEKRSVAQTIFDPEWKSTVRVGDSRAEGLLVGGQEPRVTLLDAAREILAGDEVYSASRDLPYGLAVGSVAAVIDAANSTFKEAILSLLYNTADLDEVLIHLE